MAVEGRGGLGGKLSSVVLCSAVALACLLAVHMAVQSARAAADDAKSSAACGTTVAAARGPTVMRPEESPNAAHACAPARAGSSAAAVVCARPGSAAAAAAVLRPECVAASNCALPRGWPRMRVQAAQHACRDACDVARECEPTLDTTDTASERCSSHSVCVAALRLKALNGAAV